MRRSQSKIGPKEPVVKLEKLSTSSHWAKSRAKFIAGLSHGLHGINKKIPEMILKRDLLSFSLQLFSLFACVFSAILWVIFGFDSTIDGISRLLLGKTPVDMGNGTHISTVLNLFLLVFLISNYLSKKDIKAFHNVLISIFTPIVGMMVFEFAWFIMDDVFHNIPVEGYPAITFFGMGKIDFGMLAFALTLIPTSVFYFAFILGQKILLADRTLLRFSEMAFLGVFSFIGIISIWVGTLTVLIRNCFALFFVAFADATFRDATKNWTQHDLIGKYKISFRKKEVLIATAVSAAIFLVWVFWPYFDVVKGSLWPQTMYAFYSNTSAGPALVYVPNNAVRLLNVLAKAAVSAAAALAIVPRIEVKKK